MDQAQSTVNQNVIDYRERTLGSALHYDSWPVVGCVDDVWHVEYQKAEEEA
jgi:hypothetical protein